MAERDIRGAEFDLEARRIEADLEIRRAELEEKRAQREADQDRHLRDAELKRFELTLGVGRGIRFTTAQASVAAAALALVSGAIGGIIQAWVTRDVEASKSSALVAIERLKADANIALEKQKQESTERLDRAKFETTLILKATESTDREEQIRNLKFFLKAGFISDPGDKIAQMDQNELPSSPPPAAVRVSSLPLIGALAANSPIRRLGRPIGLLATATSGLCTGWLIDTMHVLTAAYCVTPSHRAPTSLTFRLGYVSTSETGDAYPVAEMTEYNDKIGYAVLKVGSEAGIKYGWLPLLIRPVELGEEIMIIQHGGGGVQQFSDQNCTVVRTTAALPKQESMLAFAHRCQSDFGSGGAPIVAKRDNAVLGIVHSGGADKTELAVSMTAIVEGSTLVRQLTSRSGAR